MLANLNPITAIVNAGTGLAKVLVGDKAARETRRADLAEKMADADENIRVAAMAQYASEFAHAPQNWFDSLINGLNRLPRPAMAFMVIALVVIAVINPEYAERIYRALAAIPDKLWMIIGIVITFYFGARHLEKRMK